MRTVVIAFSIFTMSTFSHAAPFKPAAGAKTQSAATRTGLPKLVDRIEEDFGGGVFHQKTYRMPSGREVKIGTYGLGEKTFTSKNYEAMERQVSSRDAGDTVEVRTLTDNRRQRETVQNYNVPAKRGTLVRMETMRHERGAMSDVKRATYREIGFTSPNKSVVLAPGGSQVEERAPHIDEAAIAKKYGQHQARKADLEAAFGAQK